MACNLEITYNRRPLNLVAPIIFLKRLYTAKTLKFTKKCAFYLKL